MSKSRREQLEEQMEAKRLLASIYGPTVGPSLKSLATLQQAWRFLHHDGRVSFPTEIQNYLNFSMYVYLEVAKYGVPSAVPYCEALRDSLVTVGYDLSLLNQLALMQGFMLS